MFDPIGVSVSNYEKSKHFDAAALAPLGHAVVMEFGGDTAGLGAGGKPDFWLSQCASLAPAHSAFTAKDRATVGAFVVDPDGNNVEAACHAPG
jgi:catechol 2,3-dioxygenase-like lactoylglutathione lyase family enzyme